MSDIEICTRTAGAILLHRGEITISDIKALPLVGDQDIKAIEYIASILLHSFNAERFQRKIHGSKIGYWEEVICLKNKPVPQTR